MATLTRVQHNFMATNTTTASSASFTLGTGVTSGNLLVATLALGTNGLTVTPPTGWAQAGPAESVSGSLQTQIYYLVVGAGGATSFSFSWGSAHSYGWTIDEWNSSTGWMASPVDSSAGAANSGGSTAVNCGSPAGTVQASELWYGVLSWADSGESLSGITSGWTQGDTAVFTSNNTNVSFYQAATAAGTPSLAATLSASVVNAGVVATFKPAAAALVSPPPFLTAPGWQAPSSLSRRQPPMPPPPAAVVPGTAGLSGSGSLTAGGAFAGAASLSGNGSLTAAGGVTGANLSGTGTLTASGVFAGTASLTGAGSLTAAETLAALSGEGTLTASGVLAASAALSGAGSLGTTAFAFLRGTGTLAAVPSVWYANLAGAGTLGISGETLGYIAQLTGAGYLSIPQVVGGLVNGTGGAAAPQALPGSSQVAVAPPGSSNWQWLSTLGTVTALTYSYVCPGGPDKMQMTLMVPAAYRNQMFNPGQQVRIVRGGHQVWYGKLDEPQPSPQGWTLTAVGAGNLGQNFDSHYSVASWPTGVADDILNRAISRGLPWVNPGMSSSPYYSQFWFGQQFDAGSQKVNAFLNLICTRGALTWYVSSQPGGSYGGNNLSVFPLPSVPNRLLVCTTPVARTLGGYINYLIIRYEQTADNTAANTAASYAYTSASNPASIAAHGQLEDYLDLSNAGVLTSTQAQNVGSSVLQIYEAASWAGPFTASYGQLLNTGGAPIDPGTDQAGTRVRLIVTDAGYGGEVAPTPIEFTVGSYSWDDFKQIATITPFVELDSSLSGLAQMISTTMTPLT